MGRAGRGGLGVSRVWALLRLALVLPVAVDAVPFARSLIGRRVHTRSLEETPNQEWSHRDLYARERGGNCWSQHEQHLYYKSVAMTGEFRSALGKYEEMHERCTRNLDWEALQAQWSKGEEAPQNDCKYIIYEPADRGLGNRLISLASTFALALLTNRALLVPEESFVGTHLCNPFQASSWALDAQQQEKLTHATGNGRKSIEDLGLTWNSTTREMAVGVDMTSIATSRVANFFCSDTHEQALQQVPVLFLKADNYFIPGLHFIDNFDKELTRWFPDGRAFHQLGRFLIHPVNKIWFRITRYYDAYLRHHSKIVGVQIRQYGEESDRVDERVLECLRNNSGVLQGWRSEDEFLQQVGDGRQRTLAARQAKSIAILVTSLNETHADALSDFATNNVPPEGEAVSILRISHEGHERMDWGQYEQALMEMILLSMSDDLLTTDFSTFGYVAAGLSGMSPYSLNIVSYLGHSWWSNGRAVCQPVSTEPCLHKLPESKESLQCGSTSKDAVSITPSVGRCDAIDDGFQVKVLA